MTRLASALTRFSERFIPSAFVIAALLTFLTFGLGMLAAGKGFLQCVGFWGDGFWALLEFGMQMCLILMTGSILADAPALRRLLDEAARVPRTPRQTVAFMAFASMALCWLHWGLGMIASAFLARSLVKRHPKTDYRLLVACAYFGMGAVWHAGLSGSALLLVATPKHFLEDKIGLIPLSLTVFSPFNLALTVVVMAALVALAWAMYPAPQDAFTLPPEALAGLEDERPRFGPAPSPWIRLVERTWAVNLLLAGLGALWLFLDFQKTGFNPTFNKLNFLFLMAGLLLHPSPTHFAHAAEKAGGFVHGIIVQFPLYAGIFGIIKGAGLDHIIGGWFVSMASERTFPLVVYWYSGILNYFIPSGGSKWAVEGPYILEAAKTLGVPYPKVVLAYAWGDMVTDMIQPFFCLPLLAVARLEFKDIFGYEAITFLVCTALGSAAFLLI